MAQRYFIGLKFSIKRVIFTNMKKTHYRVVGVMSGTSLDGVDLVHCSLSYLKGQWVYAILQAETIPYENQWFERLSSAHESTLAQIDDLDMAYTRLLGTRINDFISRHEISNLDAVCSHGHTVLHQPENKMTRQIGNRQELADVVGCRVVCDFRVQDVALGGQGAPLVPIGDRLLFASYTACLNIGGFANASIRHPTNSVAFDIAPANIVLNHWASQLGAAYDQDGHWASQGVLKQDLWTALNALPFYDHSGPKSLGREWVGQNITPLYTRFGYAPKDWLATFSDHLAYQIHRSLRDQKGILVTGGGAFNHHLMSCLERYQPGAYILPERTTIEFKEALVFGLLGVLRLRGENNCLAAVTGASQDHSSGCVFMPSNFTVI